MPDVQERLDQIGERADRYDAEGYDYPLGQAVQDIVYLLAEVRALTMLLNEARAKGMTQQERWAHDADRAAEPPTRHATTCEYLTGKQHRRCTCGFVVDVDAIAGLYSDLGDQGVTTEQVLDR